MKKSVILIALVLFSQSLLAQMNFEKGTVSEVLAKAKAENKVVMVDVLTDWCVWCVELDNLVYSRPDVYEYANVNQINYKIDAEKGEGIAFKEKYDVQGYPTILFLDGDGNEVDRIYGYYPAAQFKEMMVDYSQKKNTTSDLKARLEKDPNDIEANYRYADKLIGKNDIAGAKSNYELVIQLDPENKSGRADDANYMLAELSDKETIIANLEKFISENPDSDMLKDAYISVGDKYNTVKSDVPTAEKWYNEALAKYPNDDQVKLAYGRFLNSQARVIGKMENASVEDIQRGLTILESALPYVKGSTSEAASYYWQSEFYFRMKDYTRSMESIDKAIKIFDAKLYKEQKEKVEKQLSSK
jgi:thioredoxin-related protein